MATGHNYEAIFRVYDTDDSGYLDRDELAAMLREFGATTGTDQFMTDLDLDRNGKLTYSEFAKLCDHLFTSEK
ncbi:EF-hand domain-containing protein [Nocardia pseudobrasiliensis]|uniref:EF hand domain-containing protein n=1 Tax=Nocardia pseudobrasiliensis TaxID=45979 RepID=A0A370I465_9NOCA|nr:EF-hand domain-containing protein [Nocardia pseudobrasiliensis]RDI65527.1 EF hand domain-containing protein [Nocardia pseudobrasiliensis]